MPHIPRSSTSTSGIRPELLAQVRANRPAIAAPPPAAEQKKKPGARIGLDKISPHTYQPDTDAMYSLLFGTEAKTDEHTRELVFTKRPDVTPPVRPGG